MQGCISYTLSPVHNNEYFAKYAKTLEEMGADSICIKDMAGLLTPYTCYDLVKKLKETVSIPVDIHSHYTAGLASMSILKGIEAGADIVDTAMSPLALGTSHMPTESLVAALQGTDYDTGLDLNQLNVVRAYFAKLREKYIANGQINPKSLGVDANTLLYQVPGGMFSNMLKQLKDAGREDKLDEVLAEIPRVREDAGYPPLVTPTSQIVGTQAVFNVIMGERYKMVTKEFKGLVHGDYGKTPAPIKPEFTKKILGRRAAHYLPLCRHAGSRNGQAEGRSCQVCHPGRRRSDLRYVPAGCSQVLRKAQCQKAGRGRRSCGLHQPVSSCLINKLLSGLLHKMLCSSLFLHIRQRHKTYSVGQSRKNFCLHIDLPPNTFYNVWYSRTIQQMMWRKMLCEASRSSALLSFRSRTINCILAFQSWNLTGCSRLCMRLTVS